MQCLGVTFDSGSARFSTAAIERDFTYQKPIWSAAT